MTARAAAAFACAAPFALAVACAACGRVRYELRDRGDAVARVDDGAATDGAAPPDDGAPGDGATFDAGDGGDGRMDAGASDAPADDAAAHDAPVDRPCVPQVITLAVTSDDDDGEITMRASATWLPQGEPPRDGNPSALYVGYRSASPTWGYFRFALDRAIPPGARVIDARLRLWGLGDFNHWASGDDVLRVQIENSGDAPVVTDAAQRPDGPAPRFPIGVVVRWPAAGPLFWTTGDWNVSADLAPLVQGLVDARGGLAAGAHVQLWLDGVVDPVRDAQVATEDFSQPGAHHATLAITVCP